MSRIAVLVVAVLAGTAHAVPVADGIELVADGGTLLVARGKLRVGLGTPYGTYDLKAIKVDKGARTVAIPLTTECVVDKTLTFTFDQLEARLVNAEALAQ